MKRNTLILLLSLMGDLSFGQGPQNFEKIILSGRIIDRETKEPLEYATITAKNVRKPEFLQGGITDSEGNFSFAVSPGRYTLVFEYISFDPVVREAVDLRSATDLGVIELSIAVDALEEVELVGERTEVEIRLDKRVYNVGRDITVRGGSVSDVMDNIPAVSVDVDGSISLRGNNNVRILINGKPSGLVGLSGPDALRQLPAESIEKVEVITSPSARYEAAGTAGILNIILKKQELIGFNGSFIANGGFPKTYGGSAALNLRSEKINYFATVNYRNTRSNSSGLADTRFVEPNDTVFFTKEVTDNQRDRENIFVNAGIEYYFDDDTSLVVSGFVRNSDNESDNNSFTDNFDANNALVKSIARNQLQTGNNNSQQFTVNYTNKFDEDGQELIVEYQRENSTEESIGSVANSSVRDQNSSRKEAEGRTLLQLDYVYPMDKNTQIELGYRGNFSRQETDYQVKDFVNGTFVNNPNFTNYLVFEQNVNAAYTQFGKKINAFSYLLGLRMESTQIIIDQRTSNTFNEKKYTDWFPTLNLAYELSEMENITLGYSRRIRRPRSYLINPFRSITNLTFFFQGNIDLDPTYTNSIDFGYLKRLEKFTFNGSIYYQRSTQNFSRISEATDNYVDLETGEYFTDPTLSPNPTVRVLQSTFINLANNQRTGTEFTLTYSPKRRVRISGNFNLYNSETTGEYNGQNLDASIVSWFARVNASFPLPYGMNSQLRAFYRGPRANALTKTEGLFSFTAALNKNLWKKKATLSFRASDIFNTYRSRSKTQTPNFTTYNEYQWRNPTFIFTFTYRINESENAKKRRNNNYASDGGGYEDY